MQTSFVVARWASPCQAIEGERVKDGAGNVLERQAGEEDGTEESREDAASDAAESGDGEGHDGGVGANDLDSEWGAFISNRTYII